MSARHIRQMPGDLEFLTPDCPICTASTDAVDRGLSCYRCGIAWDADGANPERIDPDAKQCRSLYQSPYNAKLEYRCWMDAGHDGEHHNPDSFYGWTTADQSSEAES